jgi:D-alanyl-D-alanine carboxypeptidase (penicillin-binding protein 5/6)
MICRRIPFVTALVSLALLLPAPAATKKQTTSTTAKKKAVATRPATPERPSPSEPYPTFEPGGAAPVISGAAAIVVDADTGGVLHELNADQTRQVASTQKLLTALIIAESGDLDQRVVVQPSDTWAEPSKLYLKAGDVYERGQLLRILLVKSMNDVARCLARDNAGSVEAFAAKMNARARALGMTSSRFVNPNGLPDSSQYSTARDMARVAMAAYRNSTIRNIVRLRQTVFQYADGRTRTFQNTNQVLKNFPLCNGMKTGYTEAAGHCLISSASHNGRDIISVVLGDSKQIWVDSYRLLAWGLTL